MKKDTKNLIIDTTIALIQKTDGDPECITNRDISKEAGIAVSQINYHFQTKENLLNQCVQKMVGHMIQGLEGYPDAYGRYDKFRKVRKYFKHDIHLSIRK
ncbi:MAG: TetR/AcrR family transcriptional regulator [Coprobacillus cateniformis]